MTATPRQRLAWWLCLAGAPLAFVAALLAADRPVAVDPAFAVARAFVWSGAQAPTRAELVAPRDARWVETALPYWRAGASDVVHEAWLRVEPTPAQWSAERLAVFAAAPSGTFDLYVAGERVGGGGRTVRPAIWHAFPLLFAFARPSQAPAAVVIHAVREGRSAWVPPLWLGPVAPLARAASERWWFVAGVPRAAALVAVCFALLATGFSALRPNDTAYAWFAGAVAFWLAHLARDHVAGLPVDRPVWVAATNVALGAFVFCAIGFVHRFVEHDARRLERAMAVALVAGAVVLLARALVFRWDHANVVTIPWVLLVNAGGVYLVDRLARAAWRRPDADRLALLAAASATSGVGIRDFLYDFDVWLAGSTFYLGHALALVVLVFGTIVVRRFASAVEGAERLNEELHARVRRKAAELEAQHERLRDLEAEAGRRAERERLMRQIHDGLGGQIVQGIAVAARGGDRAVLADILTACLRDLERLYRVGAPDAGALSRVVSDFCTRIAPRLGAAGIELAWRTAPGADLALDAAQADELLGILQEAVTNALKHSGCRRIELSVERERAALVVALRDDGSGLSGAGAGHGLAGMRERAARLGAELAIDGASGGTAVRVVLPRVPDSSDTM
jgi:signal transduction histidine kinase